MICTRRKKKVWERIIKGCIELYSGLRKKEGGGKKKDKKFFPPVFLILFIKYYISFLWIHVSSESQPIILL